MTTAYNWTTGPVSSSLGYDSTLIVVLNNTSQKRKVQIRFYDLSFNPKKEVRTKTATLQPWSTTTLNTEYPEVYRSSWEVQITAHSKKVLAWVGGRRLNSNLPGNTILHSKLKRL